MEVSLAQRAVSLALSGDWQEAVKVNLEILKDSPKDVDALNRLARAYSEIGNIVKAKATAGKALKIDPQNSIAQRCLDKWKAYKKNGSQTKSSISIDAFLEESGKTKIISLLNLGELKSFANLDPGEEVKIDSHAHRISIVSSDGKYIGRLPDDLSARLRKLIKSGNKYQVLIKSVEPKEVIVFIRELSKDPSVKNILSFPPEKIDYVTFTPPELVHKDTPAVETTEET